MNIPEAIIARILQDKSVTLTQLEQLASKRAVSLSDLYVALDKVARDKRIKRGVRRGEVYYEPAPPPKTPTDHLKWVRENYPRPGQNGVPEFVMPWIEWDLGFMFLKTKEERDLFISQMKGRPMMYTKKKYAQEK